MGTYGEQRNLSTADLAAAADARPEEQEREPMPEEGERMQEASIGDPGMRGARAANEEERLAPLFSEQTAKDFRARWDAVQGSFVDDPRQAVRQGDELVAQVMKSLAQTFSTERSKLESQLEQSDDASTENLRLALRRYRSFFERLLAL
jgi:hypothetical protein